MTAFSNYLEDELLDHSLGTGATFPQPTVYLALYKTDPTDANTGTEVDPTVTTGDDTAYARQLCPFNASSGGSATNTAAETFAAAVLQNGSYTVTHFGIVDNAAYNTGNLLYHAPLSASILRTTGETVVFAAGSITITLD